MCIMGVIGESHLKWSFWILMWWCTDQAGAESKVVYNECVSTFDILTFFFYFLCIFLFFAYRTNFAVFIVSSICLQYVAANNWRGSCFTGLRFLTVLYSTHTHIYVPELSEISQFPRLWTVDYENLFGNSMRFQP